MKTQRTLIWTVAAAALAAMPAIASPDRDLDPLESYSYVRVLEGQATLASAGEGPGEEAETNQPLLAGDRVSVARGARIEIALADRNLLRVGGDTSLALTRIAFSGDSGDRSTRIDLEQGEIVLEVTADALGDALPEVGTPGAEVVVHEPGLYRIETDRSGWTSLVVRDGFAEVVTARGSTVVRGGETATAYGDRWSGVELASAGAEDTLERWGAQLLARARASAGVELHVEPELAYQAAPLDDYGSWVSYESAWYWRPRVAVDWRPYWQGRWAWSPSGLTWVSSEPWGWVPYHYGTWTRLPGYGWAWCPGRVYSPAWVYWHWSDAWVGWCPVGYYTGWYGPGYYGSGFRFGVYGWASGGWDIYSYWNFGPTDCLRRRHQRDRFRRGGDLARELGPRAPRGIVTTDTRGLPRRGFADVGVAKRELMHRVETRIQRDPLVDVTDFVGRRRDLPPAVEKAVRSEPGARIRLAEVPRVDSGELGKSSSARRGELFRDLPPGSSERVRATTRVETEPRRATPPSSGKPAIREPEPRTPVAGERGKPLGSTTTDDRQGWRGNSREDRFLEPRDSRGSSSGDSRGISDTRPAPPRLAPGERAEIGSDGRIRRLPPTALPPAAGSDSGSSGRAVPNRPPADSRQGWKSSEGWTGPVTRGSGDDRTVVRPPSGSSSGRDEPVQRVFGGWRRNEAPAPQTLPPSSAYRRPDTRYVAPSTRTTPGTRSAPTPRSAPTTRTVPTPRTGPPTRTERSVTPPPSSRPTATPPPSSSSGARSSSSSRSAEQRSHAPAKRDSSPPHRKHDG